MDKPTCKTCPYFEAGDENNGDGFDAGYCHRSSPIAIPLDDDHEDSVFVLWPKTLKIEWCGEHPQFPTYLASLSEPAKVACYACLGTGKLCGEPCMECMGTGRDLLPPPCEPLQAKTKGESGV